MSKRKKLPLPPLTTDPDFSQKLRDWKEATGLTLDELDELLPFGRATFARWLAGDLPSSKAGASHRWNAFAQGRLPRELRKKARDILAQADKIEDLFD